MTGRGKKSQVTGVSSAGELREGDRSCWERPTWGKTPTQAIPQEVLWWPGECVIPFSLSQQYGLVFGKRVKNISTYFIVPE